jgi:Fur family peroxide stress response transcriptional regulator
MYNYVKSHQYLKAHNIKPSIQRTAVMHYLLKHRTHPTIDEIFSALSPSMPTLSKTTVYNTLNLFLEKGAVQSLTIDERNIRYDIDISKHAHFKCKICGKVIDIFTLSPEMYEKPQVAEFSIETVEISYMGICNECQKN